MTTPAPRFEGDEEIERILDDLEVQATSMLAPALLIPLCAECLVLLAEHNDDDHPAILLTPEYELRQMVAHGAERAIWSFGRKLQSLARRDRELVSYLRMIREEVEHEREKIGRQMAALDGLIGEYALNQREGDPNAKSLHVPGVGTWQTRKQGASWRTDDEAAVVASLAVTPDEFALYTEEQSRRVLLKDDFKKYLEATGFDAFPGMTLTPEHVTVKGPF